MGSKESWWTDGRDQTLEMVKPMRDMMTKMEETVENMTLEQLMEHLVWAAAVSTTAVVLIPKEANQMPTPLDFRPITVTSFLYGLWAGRRFVDVTRRTSHSRGRMDCVVGNVRRRGRSCHGGNRLVQVLRHDCVGGGLLHDGEDGSPRPCVEAPAQLRSRAIVW